MNKLDERLEIDGIAIKPGISRNNVKYTKETLKKFTPTLKNRPILLDHASYDVKNNIGVVTDTDFVKNKCLYEGWIKNPEHLNIIERCKDGRIKEVSIGAIAERVYRESEDSEILIVEGLNAMELSLISCAGVEGTSLNVKSEKLKNNSQKNNIKKDIDNEKVDEKVDKEVVDIKESVDDDSDINHENKKEESKMEENKIDIEDLKKNLKEELLKELKESEDKKEEEEVEDKEDEVKEEDNKAEEKEEKEDEVKEEKVDVEKMKTEILKELKESLKEKPKANFKSKKTVKESKVFDKNNYCMESHGSTVSLFKMPKSNGMRIKEQGIDL
jgi:hypothetical protein